MSGTCVEMLLTMKDRSKKFNKAASGCVHQQWLPNGAKLHLSHPNSWAHGNETRACYTARGSGRATAGAMRARARGKEPSGQSFGQGMKEEAQERARAAACTGI